MVFLNIVGNCLYFWYVYWVDCGIDGGIDGGVDGVVEVVCVLLGVVVEFWDYEWYERYECGVEGVGGGDNILVR